MQRINLYIASHHFPSEASKLEEVQLRGFDTDALIYHLEALPDEKIATVAIWLTQAFHALAATTLPQPTDGSQLVSFI